jgi:hypothetical protein
MMNSESLVRDIVEAYHHAGFIHDNIKNRDLFLTLLVVCFVAHQESNYYDEFTELLFNIVDEADLEALKSQVTCFKKASHSSLILSFVDEAIASNDLDLLSRMTSSLSFLLLPETLEAATAAELTGVYDHVLQRLQAMNAQDRLAKKFDYQEPPFDFSELIALLANKPLAHRAYDPYATTGESSVSYALHTENACITTESVMQTAKYISHKLIIAGVNEIDAKHSYALSPTANVPASYFDVAYTLLQPTETSEIAEYEQLKNYDKNFLDGRIDKNTIFDKYREHGFIQHMLWSLKDDGIGFVVLGKGPLHRQFESDARNLLLANNFVDAVIELPPKLITSRTVPLYLLVLKKSRHSSSTIKFIDGSSFCEFDGRRNKLINIKQLADIYHSGTTQHGLLAEIDVNQIDRNSALLTVSSYLIRPEATYEQIDTELIRKELSRQQKITDLLMAKLTLS